MTRDESYLIDIYRYAQEAVEIVEDMNADDFEINRQAQYAVLYTITVIGEAVKRLSPEFRASHSTIAWKQIAGMRDKLIHDYRETDVPLVWGVLHKSLPELMKLIEPLLPKQ